MLAANLQSFLVLRLNIAIEMAMGWHTVLFRSFFWEAREDFTIVLYQQSFSM